MPNYRNKLFLQPLNDYDSIVLFNEQYPIKGKKCMDKKYSDNSIVQKFNNDGILSKIKRKFKSKFKTMKKKVIEMFQLKETKNYIEEKRYVETDDSITMYRRYISKTNGDRCIETYKVYDI